MSRPHPSHANWNPQDPDTTGGPHRVLWSHQAGPTVVDVAGVPVGGGPVVVMAGPCAVESAVQLEAATAAVAGAGGHVLRGGTYKPRTSPYAFQGLGAAGLPLLSATGRRHGLPVVAEVVDAAHLGAMLQHVDLLQVGARNMQNYALLQALGAVNRPVLLKRSFAATLDEWLLAAEYIAAAGNPNVILCERGIRTFEPRTRFTLDLAGVAWVKQRSHLPVVVDPSHATGIRSLVVPMAVAAVAAGADGLLVEVHANPDAALCDGPQALTPAMFDSMMTQVHAVAAACGRSVWAPNPPWHAQRGAVAS